MDRVARLDRVWLYFTFFEGCKKENKKKNKKRPGLAGALRSVVQSKKKYILEGFIRYVIAESRRKFRNFTDNLERVQDPPL